MASSISSNYTGQLDSSYISMINDLMAIERQPLTVLTTQRDDITVRKGIYADLKGMLDSLQTSTKALISSDPSYTLTPGRSAQVNAASGLTVLTATAASSTAVSSYAVHVNRLATAHRVMSDKQSGMTTALNLSGTFTVGGAGSLTNSTTLAGTVGSFSAANSIDSGQTELANGEYSVETMNDSGTWKFRLVDSTGGAVAIRDGAGPGVSSSWQDIPTGGGDFNTGRGLTISLGADSASYQASTRDVNAAKVTYTAGRNNISVTASDTLMDVAFKINHATYPTGKGIVATVVDSQLVLTSKQTGTANQISIVDQSGTVLQSLGVLKADGSFKSERTPVNAELVVNGLPPITRSSNTGLTDVIGGVTLNLANDAEGKDATLNIQADTTTEKKSLNSFIQSFNSLTSYLNGKLATTKQADGSYKRGSLAGDDALYNLKIELARLVNGDSTNVGTLKNMRQIGISLGDNFQLKIDDASKLEEALTNNKDNVVKLIDTVMGLVNIKVGRFTGKSGYVTTIQTSLDQQTKATTSRIDQLNQRLDARQNALYLQFAQAQDQITEMTYTAQRMKAMFGY